MPVTIPVAVTDVAPLPRLITLIPSLAPVTPAALTVRFTPVFSFKPYIPRPVAPVTDPVVVTEIEPVPLFRKSMPSWLPETSVAVTVKSVPGELFVA